MRSLDLDFESLIRSAKDFTSPFSRIISQNEVALFLSALNQYNLTKNFVDEVTPIWLDLAEKRGVYFYIDYKTQHLKDTQSYLTSKTFTPSIRPMIWSHGEFAVIKLTL